VSDPEPTRRAMAGARLAEPDVRAVAKLMRVCPSHVRKARAVIAHGPAEHVAAIDAGGMSVGHAYKALYPKRKLTPGKFRW
jgi:hypothetical protein